MNQTPSHRVFLLGGYDLEMITIRQMLEERGDCAILDRQLRWDNAMLSAYKNDWMAYAGAEFYGVELQEDCDCPPNYYRVDHHNELTHLPSSLEQVAMLLGMALNREQQLVAANDRGYIPAMMAMGATDNEIVDIRRRDRAIQGVSETEELLAERSVAENMSRYDGLIVVRSLTSRFSPICDQLFPYRRLLVYTDDEWMFYGEGKNELAKSLASEIEQRKVFHGGGANGYIGTVRSVYGKDEIDSFVKKIVREYGNI